MNGMFSGAMYFNQPLEAWDVSNVTDMRDMFRGATSLNQPFDTWGVSPGTDAQGMFEMAGCRPSLRVTT
jgi:surface protein